MICNMDCLHCIHPDCLNDQLTPDDYKASTERDRDSVKDNRDAKGQRLAAHQKAYYAANRDKVAAQKKIRDRRKAAGYTQRELAALIGVHFTTISLWENYKVPADWDKLDAVFPNIKKEVLTNDR